jgi:hypothetical protein
VALLGGELRSCELLYKVFDALSNLVTFRDLRMRMYKDSIIKLIQIRLDKFFKDPSGTEEDIENMVTIALWIVLKLVPPEEELEDSNLEADVSPY